MDLELTNNARSLLSDQTFHAVFGAKLEHEDDRTLHLPQQAAAAAAAPTVRVCIITVLVNHGPHVSCLSARERARAHSKS